MRLKSFLLSFFLLFSYVIKADSPLTSSNFYHAYKDIAIVKAAADGNGIIQQKEMEFLSDKKQLIDQKMALINALSWDFNGKENYRIYLSFLEKKYNCSVSKKEKKFYKKITADECLSLAYLLALDNYFEVAKALEIANIAVEKSKKAKKSYCFHIIRGLIEAQSLFSDSWCALWKATDKVRKNEELVSDMREEAKQLVFDYMDLYKDDCR